MLNMMPPGQMPPQMQGGQPPGRAPMPPGGGGGMSPQQAIQLLQSLGVSPDMLPQLAQAVKVLSGGGEPEPDADDAERPGLLRTSGKSNATNAGGLPPSDPPENRNKGLLGI